MCVETLLDKFEYSLGDLKALLKENFDDKGYRKEDVEAEMGVSFVKLVRDVDYAEKWVDSIFSVNVYR